MIDEIEQCKKDINYESEDLINVNFDKFVGWEKAKIGDRVVWCYNEDVKFWKEEHYFDSNPKGKFEKEDWYRDHCQYQGILFTLPEKRFNVSENAVVCCYDWPIEKDNPDVFWVSLDRLLISPDLYRVYKL